MKLYLTKQIGENKFFLTRYKPVLSEVKGTNRKALYLEIGEPIGVINLCLEGVKSLFGMEIEEFIDGESIRVKLEGKIEAKDDKDRNSI